MSNDTIVQLDQQQVIVNVLFMIFGLWAVVGNGIIMLTVGLSIQLREKKEMAIVAAMAMGDFIYGFGYLYGGCRRLFLLITSTMQAPVTKWYCMREVATFFYIVGPQIGSMMSLVISIDRFIAVTFIRVHQAITLRFTQMVIGIVVMWAMVSYVVGFIISYKLAREAIVFKQCLSSWSSSKSYIGFYTGQIALCATMSVVIYFGVMIVLHLKTKTASDSVQSLYYERQIKVTKTLGMITLLTLLFYVIPWLTNIALSMLSVKLGKAGFIAPMMWQLISINNAINIVIYMWKFTEMRQALLKMIRCKKKNNVFPTQSKGATVSVKP